MRSRVIYIDESGDENLNISRGASEFYVLAAVIVAEAHAQEFRIKAEALRTKYFQRGEIKSSKIGGNIERRLKILAFAKAQLPPFSVVAYRVRKRLVNPESGLRFPKSFIKYFADDFCKYLPASGVSETYFDEKGKDSFKAEFIRYLHARLKDDDLFARKKFDVCNSATCIGIQIADLYAGSMAKLTEAQHTHDRDRLYSLLRDACCTWDWPKPILWGEGGALEANEKLDNILRSEALHRAVAYVETHQDSSEESILRCEFLKSLIDHSIVASEEFLMADRLEDRLSRISEKPLGTQALRNRIVGPLRDDGILISSKTSRPDPGYKLPTSMRDIESYIELTDAQVIPALRRVKSTAQIVATATNGDMDLLSQERFRCIRSLTNLV